MSCKLFHMPYYISEHDFKFLKFWAKVTSERGYFHPCGHSRYKLLPVHAVNQSYPQMSGPSIKQNNKASNFGGLTFCFTSHQL
jgi:hypothetical protein